MALDQVELQSKILKSVLKAFGITPTVPGLIEGMGGDPAKVFELVRFVQDNGARLTQSFEAAVIGTAARVERIEAQQDRMMALLMALALKSGIEITVAEIEQLPASAH